MPTFTDPARDANEAYEALRGLAHATRTVEDPSDTYAVIGDQFAGFLFIDNNGFADLNLDSRDGDAVPLAAAGDPVFVVDFFTDTVLLFGTFAPR